jgi:hypothetical protein
MFSSLFGSADPATRVNELKSEADVSALLR